MLCSLIVSAAESPGGGGGSSGVRPRVSGVPGAAQLPGGGSPGGPGPSTGCRGQRSAGLRRAAVSRRAGARAPRALVSCPHRGLLYLPPALTPARALSLHGLREAKKIPLAAASRGLRALTDGWGGGGAPAAPWDGEEERGRAHPKGWGEAKVGKRGRADGPRGRADKWGGGTVASAQNLKGGTLRQGGWTASRARTTSST